MRKIPGLNGLALVAAATLAVSQVARAQEPEKPDAIIVNTSGGENGPMLREAYFDAFEEETGIRIIDTSPTDFGRLRAMVESGNVEWTVTEIEAEDALRAVEMDLLQPIDEEIVDRSKFEIANMSEYLYPLSSYATVIGYSTKAFPEGGPQNWAEFWDVETFPGPRAMRDHPIDNLEAALLADGVAPEDLYPLDVDRAFAKLDEIEPHVATWWTTGAQQAQLLIDQEVVATTGWNSRFFNAIQKDAPIDMSFGGGILKYGSYTIPQDAPHAYWGQRLMAVMAEPENQAKYAEAFGLSGPDPAHAEYVSEEIRPLLPLAPENLDKQIWLDQQWWVDNGPEVLERWTQWMLSNS